MSLPVYKIVCIFISFLRPFIPSCLGMYHFISHNVIEKDAHSRYAKRKLGLT